MKKYLKQIFIISVILLFNAAQTVTVVGAGGGGNIFYIAPNGDDVNGDGSIGNPWVTLQKAQDNMVAGDTVYCRGGKYPRQNVRWTASGTPSNWITIAAHPNETPIFGGGGTFIDTSIKHDVGYLIIDGLEIGWFNLGFLSKRGGDYIIRNCYFHDISANTAGAIHTSALPDHPIKNLTIENCTFERIGRMEEGAHDHSIYPRGKHGNIIIRNNYFKDSHGGPTIVGGPEGTSVNIYNNVFYLTVGAARTAIFIAGTTRPEGYNIYNNTIIIDHVGATWSWALKPFYYSGDLSKVVIKNNIIYYTATKTNPIITKAGNLPIMDNNIYFNTSDLDDTGANSFVADPLFTSIANEDFRLQSTSPAIDAGVALGAPLLDFAGKPRPQGQASTSAPMSLVPEARRHLIQPHQ
ncbi:MAG: choice-of-anchor Q domain-containing protein [Candidatus Scalinduaceae bacterium]